MEKNNRIAGADLLAGLAFVILGIVVFLMARDMKVFRTLIISPGLFPMILGGIFVLCGIVLMAMAIKRGGIADARRIFSGPTMTAIWASPTFRRGSTILIMMIVYVGLFGNRTLAKLNIITEMAGQVVSINIGFILITSGYLFATFMYLKAMKWTSALILSLGAAAVVFFAFNQGFGIPIP